MTRRVSVTMVLVAVAHAALAGNLIREWGGHDSGDYEIVSFGGNDVEVRIHGNTQPQLLWKFEAFDSVTLEPGYINYITIDSSEPLADIHLSVIGNPADVPYPYHGAAALKSLNLIDNGDDTNRIEQLDITGDYGEYGPMYVGGAGTLTIGGDVRQTLYISDDVAGPMTVAGNLHGGPLGGDVTDTLSIARGLRPAHLNGCVRRSSWDVKRRLRRATLVDWRCEGVSSCVG
jgi:hypothetical protein